MEERLLELTRRAPPSIQSRFIRRFYARGATILTAAEPARCLYILESGSIEVFKESYAGSEVSVNTFHTGSLFGEIEVFSPDLNPYNVRALTNCQVLVVGREDVLQWMREDFALTVFLCQIFSRRLYFTSESMSRMALLPLRERVLGCLHAQYEAGNLPTFTKKMLLDQVRAPLRSVNRILHDCAREGILDYKQKTFLVKNTKALSEYATKYII